MKKLDAEPAHGARAALAEVQAAKLLAPPGPPALAHGAGAILAEVEAAKLLAPPEPPALNMLNDCH